MDYIDQNYETFSGVVEQEYLFERCKRMRFSGCKGGPTEITAMVLLYK
jgi:hypothetical protein